MHKSPPAGDWIGHLIMDFKMEEGEKLLQHPMGCLKFTPGAPSMAMWLITDVAGDEWIEVSVTLENKASPIVMTARYLRGEIAIDRQEMMLLWDRSGELRLKDPGSTRRVTLRARLAWMSKQEEKELLLELLKLREREEEDARRALR